MNKYDFYKEIMEKYTFDEEKICKNAKRASSASFMSRNAKWMPLATAAALIVVIIGGMMFLNKPIDGEEITLASVSDDERINAMIKWEERILLGGYSDGKSYMYISFNEPMTYKQLDSALSLAATDTGVQIISLWDRSNGFTDAEIVRRDMPDASFTAAKVLIADELYFELRLRPEFKAVELEGVINDENFSPMENVPNHSDVPRPPVTIPSVPEPNDNTPDDKPDMTLNIENSEENETSEETDSTNPADIDNNNSDEPVENNENPGIQEPDDNQTSEENPADERPDDINNDNNPENPASDEPNPQPNPPEEKPKQVLLEAEVRDVTSVSFINENKFVVLTPNQILLYEIITAGSGERSWQSCGVAESFHAVHPKVSYVDSKTGTMIIISNDEYGRQTGLFIADGENGTLNRINVSGITQNYTDISYAFYSHGDIVLKAQDITGYNALFIASKHNGYSFTKVAESEDKLIILNQNNGNFMYAHVPGDANTRIYNYNNESGISEEVYLGISGEFSFARSPDVKNFAVITASDHVYIWNEASGRLTDNCITGTYVRFHRYSGNMFNSGAGEWYKIIGTEIVTATESEADQITGKTDFSTSYRLYEITTDGIKIESLPS
ncbi:MAG: hypothetical protein FWG44_07365 [Oscillospiraceae bacterium]|nr:hypothetical protein [Oscillospiraceae bacterium]